MSLTIKMNLYIKTVNRLTRIQRFPVNASFFGVMNGSCRNVRFENAEVIGYGSSCTGIVAGYLGTNALECLIENVYVSGTVSGITIRSLRIGI